MTELRIIVPTAIALRVSIEPEDMARAAAQLHRQLPVFAEEHGRAQAVIVKDNVTYLVATFRRQKDESL